MEQDLERRILTFVCFLPIRYEMGFFLVWSADHMGRGAFFYNEKRRKHYAFVSFAFVYNAMGATRFVNFRIALKGLWKEILSDDRLSGVQKILSVYFLL